jgi:hypothetical protein
MATERLIAPAAKEAALAAGFRPAVPSDPDTLLRRGGVAAALTAAGYPVSPATLATKAVRGGGPAYVLFGRVPLYRWGDALEWARSRTSPPRRSTSEADAQRGAA